MGQVKTCRKCGKEKGYQSWKEMFDWIVDHNNSCDASILIESAMNEVANLLSFSRRQENDSATNQSENNGNINFEIWIKQWRDDQQKLVDFQKKNGHPNNNFYDEGGLDMLNKIVQQLETNSNEIE